MMRFKAEAVLGIQLVMRHRAPRLAGAVGVAAAAVAGAGPPGADPEDACRLLLLVVGCSTAVCASRPFAAGAALASLGQVAVSPWRSVLGRYTGTLLVVGTLAAVLVTGVFRGVEGGVTVRAYAAAVLHAAVLAAVILALTPRVGAVVAAASGVAMTVAGTVQPSQIDGFVGTDVFSLRALSLPWICLPVPWRAAAWFSTQGIGHLGVLAAWLVGGLVAARVFIPRPRGAP